MNIARAHAHPSAKYETLIVALESRSYPIHCGTGLLNDIGAHLKAAGATRTILISDSNVAPLYAKMVEASLDAATIAHERFRIEAGEASKSFAEYTRLCDAILATKPDRKTRLIALGGGVVGDLTGFLASTLLRGVPFVQIPTSLLAQVDSSVGGKTGINTAHGKNLIGSFYQPEMVLIDTDTLQTLPKRERLAGYAEVYKYGLIRDEAFAHWCEQNGGALIAGDVSLQQEAILRCCQHKAEVVAADEREAGERALLNLGHTFGHALEAAAGYDGSLLHGEGVAIGMVLAAQLSEALDMAPDGTAARIEAHLRAVGLPTRISDTSITATPDALIASMMGDKKTEDGKLVFILLDGVGRARIIKNVAPDDIRPILEASQMHSFEESGQ